MAVDTRSLREWRKIRGGESNRPDGDSGQSVLEFLLVLPAVVVLIVMMVRVNTAIQVSIVNQKYARAQALFLAYNSPYFPELRHQKRLQEQQANQLVIGVSNRLADRDQGATFAPDPVIYKISRPGGPPGNDTDPEATHRDKVRIRTTVSICTHPTVINMDGQIVPNNARNMNDGVGFPYCKGAF